MCLRNNLYAQPLCGLCVWRGRQNGPPVLVHAVIHMDIPHYSDILYTKLCAVSGDPFMTSGFLPKLAWTSLEMSGRLEIVSHGSGKNKNHLLATTSTRIELPISPLPPPFFCSGLSGPDLRGQRQAGLPHEAGRTHQRPREAPPLQGPLLLPPAP